ncbi:rac gtpase [Pelomyxa schiedti]|nr:rac gtpase [Pelomyxa schiedti]
MAGVGEETRSAKIVIVGDTGVGKTCVLISYATNTFPVKEAYLPTVSESYHLPVTVDGHAITLEVWDTGAQGEFERLRPLSYPNTEVFLICFSLDCAASLESVVNKWAPEVSHFLPHAAILLVGTKSDLMVSRSSKTEWKLTPEEVAQRIGARSYHTCSAQTQQGLVDVFTATARVVLNHH